MAVPVRNRCYYGVVGALHIMVEVLSNGIHNINNGHAESDLPRGTRWSLSFRVQCTVRWLIRWIVLVARSVALLYNFLRRERRHTTFKLYAQCVSGGGETGGSLRNKRNTGRPLKQNRSSSRRWLIRMSTKMHCNRHNFTSSTRDDQKTVSPILSYLTPECHLIGGFRNSRVTEGLGHTTFSKGNVLIIDMKRAGHSYFYTSHNEVKTF